MRDSVRNEPWMQGAGAAGVLAEHLRERRAGTSRAGDIGVTALAALLGGPAAILGAFLGGQGGAIGVLYLCAAGPVLEEILKQAGSIYLLERKPWRLFAWWQFPLAAAVSALGFATIENLVYIHVYRIPREPWILGLRWYGCTALHVGCALVASFGMLRVWRHFRATGGPVDLAPAHGWFVAAMVLHGAWNAMALGLDLALRR